MFSLCQASLIIGYSRNSRQVVAEGRGREGPMLEAPNKQKSM
jgi:hypothetical protein